MKKYLMRSLIIRTPHQILFGGSKSRRMKLVGHVAHMGARRGAYSVLVRKMKERDHLEHPDVDSIKILKWTFRKWNESKNWIDLAQDRADSKHL